MFEKGQSKRIWGELYKVIDSSDVVVGHQRDSYPSLLYRKCLFPGPNSIFAIGPYRHADPLVSPPVFSTFTFEPSTAPFTPLRNLCIGQHLRYGGAICSTTNILFGCKLRNSVASRNFHLLTMNSVLLSYPGSPVSHLITQGATSRFSFHNTRSRGHHLPETISITENQILEVASLANLDNGSQNDDIVIGPRVVSFELIAKVDVDEYKAANDLPLPMFTKLTEVEIGMLWKDTRTHYPIITNQDFASAVFHINLADPTSTYIHEPPYFKGMSMSPPGPHEVKDAYYLLNFGDSITTDPISPAGSIHKDSPEAKYLMERGVDRRDFNSYGSHRGNDEVMVDASRSKEYAQRKA
ncbi:hypothetical protein IFM89_011553 [Coptis chinensis]|uniref:Uncharacterized protein n=1 Tax=Coptis chinensis TaxID=261450 RepID=A0A835LZF7_9MAGN|nr:hypothetical protein IFM89_011553 [Coptis chinensis]